MALLLTVPPCSPPTQHDQLSGRERTDHKSFELNKAELKWPQKSRTEQKEQNRSRRGEERIAGQSGGKVMGAEQRDPAQSSLSVCTAELLLLPHLLHHLDPPLTPTTSPQPSSPPSPSPVFLFTCGSLQQPGSLLVRRTKMEGIEGGMDGGREAGWGGKQRVCFWRVSAAHMLSKESWHQSTAGNCGWGGDGGMDVL